MSELSEKIDIHELYETIADLKQEPYMIPAPPANSQHTTITNAIARAEHLFATKNAEYGDSGDILANFRRLAAQQGVPMSTAWFFLAGKHLDSITQYVKDVRENKSRNRSEPIEGRIDDMVVYSLLLLAIVAEENR
jgi:hypothetical protein